MPSRQKLGIILENKVSENQNCQKMSTVKVVYYLNLCFRIKNDFKKIDDSCHEKLNSLRKSNFDTFLRTWYYFYLQKYHIFHGVSDEALLVKKVEIRLQNAVLLFSTTVYWEDAGSKIQFSLISVFKNLILSSFLGQF